MRQINDTECLQVVGGGPLGGISRSNQSRQGGYQYTGRGNQAIDAAVIGGVAGGVRGGGPGGAAVGAIAGLAGSASSSSSRVICTHFYRKGMLDQAIWRADMAFTFKNLSPATVRGYQFWAIPYVRLMRKSTMAEKFMFPLAKWRAQELAYQMGVVSKGSLRGKLVRLTCEPICWALGVCVGEQNWQSLYEPAK